MKYFVIADCDTVLGFRYVGVRGREVATAEEARVALAQAEADSTIGVVILTEAVAELIRPEVNRIRFGVPRPLVVEIPGREGPRAGKLSLLDLIREAVGIRV